jgi:holo-[acyl-carrier protein] synthase
LCIVIIGIGVDLAEVAALQDKMSSEERVAARMFTAAEREYCSALANPPRHFAGTAAAKEAVMKALGTGWTDDVDWLDISIERIDSGRPVVVLSGGALTAASALHARNCLISISHDGAYAVACAVLES